VKHQELNRELREAKAAEVATEVVVAAEEAEVVTGEVAAVVAASAADPVVLEKTSGFPRPSSVVSLSTDTLTHLRRFTLTPFLSRRLQLSTNLSRKPTNNSVTRL